MHTGRARDAEGKGGSWGTRACAWVGGWPHPWVSHGGVMGESWGSHGRVMGESWASHGRIAAPNIHGSKSHRWAAMQAMRGGGKKVGNLGKKEGKKEEKEGTEEGRRLDGHLVEVCVDRNAGLCLPAVHNEDELAGPSGLLRVEELENLHGRVKRRVVCCRWCN